MLDKLKQLAQLKSMQDAIKQEVFTVEQEGIKIALTGALSVQELVISTNDAPEILARKIKDCFNEAVRQAQQGLAKKLTGFNF
ncbi:MAG: YbaB/EbfC family nucleoid-associated protein [Candidatus Buchananbacteria bacterium]